MKPYMGEDRALAAVEEAVAAASEADAVEAFLTVRAGEYTRFAAERIHQPQDIVERQLMVRAVVGGHAARAATSRTEDARAVASAALASARARHRAAGGDGRAAHPVAGPADHPDLELWHADTAAWDAAARTADVGHAMAVADEVAGLAYGMFGRAATELAVATTAGRRGYAAATEASGALTVKAGDGGSSYWGDLGRSADRLDLHEAVRRTAFEAYRGRRPEKLPDGVHDVVLGPLAAGELLHFMGDFGFAGADLAGGVGVVAARRGERVAAPGVRVADDALAPVGLPFPFDFEGVPKRRVPFLDDGVVGDAVTDLATATRLGGPPTGHAHIAREESPRAIPMNVVMAAGEAGDTELVAGVERGVYVQRFWYTRAVDPENTTITGVSRDGCFLIEDGRLTRPVVGARFTESVLGALSRVDAIGDRRLSQPLMNVWNGCATAPALRVRGFRFGPHERSRG